MIFQKMLDVINEVTSEVAERDELIECIAIALLSKKNLFILGDTGQAKSQCINEFRKRITGARQFERLMSKQADEEQLFGRLNLASLIPGNIPNEDLIQDVAYGALYTKLKNLYEQYLVSDDETTRKEAVSIAEKMEELKKVIYTLQGNTPKMVTEGKIPDSHVVFLDEIYKSNDGILNSLLTALNERVYTNEGQTVKIPVISFFSASNEIPDFSDSAQQILKPLYDRFDLKVFTRYVEERQNRLDILVKKQRKSVNKQITSITLSELVQMHNEVSLVKIPIEVNELMDDILCSLRKSGIHISDRKYFNYYPIVQAKAYLRGGSEVSFDDLLILKNYLWSTPEEISAIEQTLQRMCQNPIHSKLVDITGMAEESFDEFRDNQDNSKAFVKVRNELVRLYASVCDLGTHAVTENDKNEVGIAKDRLESLSKQVYEIKGYTVVSLKETHEQQF